MNDINQPSKIPVTIFLKVCTSFKSQQTKRKMNSKTLYEGLELRL